jgi:hypothetical protein
MGADDFYIIFADAVNINPTDTIVVAEMKAVCYLLQRVFSYHPGIVVVHANGYLLGLYTALFRNGIAVQDFLGALRSKKQTRH